MSNTATTTSAIHARPSFPLLPRVPACEIISWSEVVLCWVSVFMLG